MLMKKIALLFSSDTYAKKLQELLKGKTDNNIVIVVIVDIDKAKQLDNDTVLVLDAHLGNIKSDLQGLALHNEIRKKEKEHKIIAYSWLNKEQLVSTGKYFEEDNNNLFWMENYQQSVLFQFPIEPDVLIKNF